MTVHQLPVRNRDPLPRRAFHPTSEGKFYSSAWDIPEILAGLASGGWFAASASYDFASRQCAAYAHTAQEFFDTLREATNQQEPEA